MLRESRSGQDISKVSGKIPRKKKVPLTAINTSSLVIDSLHDRRKEEVSAIAWLYCDHKSVPPQTGFTVLGAIFKQLISREGMKSVLKESRGGGLMDRVMQMLRTTIASLDQVFICIDGLDEFPQENLPLLLRRLGDIVRDSPRTRIFLTGRPHVQGIVRGQFVGAVAILIYPNLRDIRNYVGMRLERDDKPGVMDNDLRADIGEMIMEKMSDRWVGAFGLSLLLVVYRCILTGC